MGTSTSADALLGGRFVIRPRPFDHPDSVAMVAAIQQLYEQLYGGHDNDTTDSAQFAPPRGLFLVGYLDEDPVASGGWRRHDAHSVEIKRMYVAGALRARGLGHRMLAELESTARAAGARRVVLNTGFRQREAIAFYEAHGYLRSDERFGHYEQIEGAYFFAKRLD